MILKKLKKKTPQFFRNNINILEEEYNKMNEIYKQKLNILKELESKGKNEASS